MAQLKLGTPQVGEGRFDGFANINGKGPRKHPGYASPIKGPPGEFCRTCRFAEVGQTGKPTCFMWRKRMGVKRRDRAQNIVLSHRACSLWEARDA